MKAPLPISRRVTWEDWHLLFSARNQNKEFFFDKAAISPLTHHRYLKVAMEDPCLDLFVIDGLFEDGSIRPVGLYGFKLIATKKSELINVHRICRMRSE